MVLKKIFTRPPPLSDIGRLKEKNQEPTPPVVVHGKGGGESEEEARLLSLRQRLQEKRLKLDRLNRMLYGRAYAP